MSVDTSGGHPEMNYREHVRTYKGFLRGMQLIIGVVLLTLVLMAIFLL
jgi:Bacterial aa3 type cytochrome c oxidase subunit IV